MRVQGHFPRKALDHGALARLKGQILHSDGHHCCVALVWLIYESTCGCRPHASRMAVSRFGSGLGTFAWLVTEGGAARTPCVAAFVRGSAKIAVRGVRPPAKYKKRAEVFKSLQSPEACDWLKVFRRVQTGVLCVRAAPMSYTGQNGW